MDIMLRELERRCGVSANFVLFTHAVTCYTTWIGNNRQLDIRIHRRALEPGYSSAEHTDTNDTWERPRPVSSFTTATRTTHQICSIAHTALVGEGVGKGIVVGVQQALFGVAAHVMRRLVIRDVNVTTSWLRPRRGSCTVVGFLIRRLVVAVVGQRAAPVCVIIFGRRAASRGGAYRWWETPVAAALSKITGVLNAIKRNVPLLGAQRTKLEVL